MTVDVDRMVRDFADHGGEYQNSLSTWAPEQWVVRTEDALVALQPHQRYLFDLIFTRDSHGRFPWQTIVWSEPKKSGKTENGGMFALWYLLSEGGLPECFAVANDRDQARARAFSAIAQVVNKNPVLAQRLRIMRDRIDVLAPSPLDPTKLIPSGSFLETVPQDYAGGAGANQAFTLWDELWAYTTEAGFRLWEEFTPVPTLLNSLRVVTTYAGFRGESELLWNLYEKAVLKGRKIPNPLGLELTESKDGSVVAFWSKTPRMPWQLNCQVCKRPRDTVDHRACSPRGFVDYYVLQRESGLRENAFRRLHGNEWTTAESAFITGDQWDALPRWDKPLGLIDFPIYCAIDAAHKRDCIAAVAVGYKNGTKFLVDYVIRKPRVGTITPETVVFPWLQELRQRGMRIRKIRYDPAHFESAGQTLTKMFGSNVVEEFTQTAGHLTLMANALYGAVFYRTLATYPCDDLREHVLNAVAIETARGWKLGKGNEQRKIDGAVALSMAVNAADEYGPTDAGRSSPIVVVRSPLEAIYGAEEEPWIVERIKS